MVCENGGCMSKIAGEQLFNLIYRAKEMVNGKDGIFNAQIEDCAVIPVSEGELLYTVDFGPLVGKDLFIAGKISALNAISDIYAMGGLPKYALVLLMLGDDLLFQEKEQILAGVYCACNEEKVNIMGGHTIGGKETVVGLSIIGELRNNRVFRKQECHIGDGLMISKPLGTGIALRGYYLGLLDENSYQYAIDIMTKSNFIDSTIVESPYTHAMTDITGFGFAGHLSEMLGKDKGAVIHLKDIPCVQGIGQLHADIMLNDYIKNNYIYAENTNKIKCKLDTIKKLALFDPQTNGPILISVDKSFIPVAQQSGFVYVGDIIDIPEIIIEGE